MSTMRVSYGVVLSLGALGAALVACSGLGSDAQTTEGAASASGPLQVACEVHYYNSSGLPNPTIFVAAHAEGPVLEYSNPAAIPLSLPTPDGVTAWVGLSAGRLSVEVLGSVGAVFIASGAYTIPSTKPFTTDLQAALTPAVIKDGVTYDRLWVGCSRATGGSADAGPFVPPPVDDASSGGDGRVDVDACQDGIACPRGSACTYDYGSVSGTCRKPGTYGGLCGGTYADFAGSDCDPGLRCDLGTAAFPPKGGSAATYLPDLTGVCHAACEPVDAGLTD